jgi:CMP-N-acetylneuraminic acid synthetase
MNLLAKPKKHTVAVIAVKTNSTRVPNKNFRAFYNQQSLLEVKIHQCKSSGAFDGVYISSNSSQARDIAERLGCNFLLRDERLCQDETPWGQVLEGILNSVPVDGETYVAWCPVTSPLFGRYKDVISQLESDSVHDSLVTVTPVNHYFLNADHIPINHQWGAWHSYSQGMRPLYQMNLACIVAQKNTMIRNQYLIGNRPSFLNTSAVEGIDIDTLDEFEIAALLYAREQQKIPPR